MTAESNLLATEVVVAPSVTPEPAGHQVAESNVVATEIAAASVPSEMAWHQAADGNVVRAEVATPSVTSEMTWHRAANGNVATAEVATPSVTSEMVWHRVGGIVPIISRKRFRRTAADTWHWPLKTFAGHQPAILSGDDVHAIALGYEALDGELLVPVYAARDGEVMFASETPHGFAITLEHARDRCATSYAHLSRMFITPYVKNGVGCQRVRGGHCIGYAACSPIHVRFEMWERSHSRGFVPVDPIIRIGGAVGPLRSLRQAA